MLLIAFITAAEAAWPQYDATDPACPSWALCEAVPGPGTNAQFFDWVEDELGITGVVPASDLDQDGVDDSHVALVEGLQEAAQTMFTDWGDLIVLGPHEHVCPTCLSALSTLTLPACGSCPPEVDVVEAPTMGEIWAVWSATGVGHPISTRSITTGASLDGTVGALGEIDHGSGHTSYQMQFDADNGSKYLFVWAAGGAWAVGP